MLKGRGVPLPYQYRWSAEIILKCRNIRLAVEVLIVLAQIAGKCCAVDRGRLGLSKIAPASGCITVSVTGSQKAEMSGSPWRSS